MSIFQFVLSAAACFCVQQDKIGFDKVKLSECRDALKHEDPHRHLQTLTRFAPISVINNVALDAAESVCTSQPSAL